MTEGWLELESDPGLFSLLLEDFGVKGVQVEEVYDIQTPFERPVYGFIFLFKWIEERRSRRKITQDVENYVMDETVVNSMFFAKQIINNSCATHALLSVLLNCKNMELGRMLTELQRFTNNMDPDDKGYAIGNMPDLARAHNSHSRPEPYRLPEKQREGISVRTGDAFHFVSYVPINNHLFELDGLKPYPIDHGPWAPTEDWTDHFRRVIADRLGIANGGGEPYHDIRFNLMSVVPDKRLIYNQKLNTLKTNRQIILETLQQMVKVAGTPDVKIETCMKNFKDSKPEAPWAGSPVSRSLLFGKDDLEEKPTMSDVVEKLESNIQTTPSQNAAHLPTVRSSARLRKKGSAYSSAYAASGNLGAFPNESDKNSDKHSDSTLDAEEVYTTIAVKIDNEETDSDVDIMDDVDEKTRVPLFISDLHSQHNVEKKQLQTVENSDVKFHISITDDKDGSLMPTTLASTDVTKPLSIQTKFGNLPPGPGTGSSTDTASEVGSSLSSPVCSTGQPSPNLFKASPNPDHRVLGTKHESPQTGSKSMAIKSELTPEKRLGLVKGESALLGVKHDMTSGSESGSPDQPKPRRKRFSRSQGFTPKDLIQLLNNVESEIGKCEHNLKEEVEKMNKYRDDDMRRTHNYDPFILTFLSMLAEQGKLAELVQEPLKKKPFSALNKKNAKKAKAKKRK